MSSWGQMRLISSRDVSAIFTSSQIWNVSNRYYARVNKLQPPQFVVFSFLCLICLGSAHIFPRTTNYQLATAAVAAFMILFSNTFCFRFLGCYLVISDTLRRASNGCSWICIHIIYLFCGFWPFFFQVSDEKVVKYPSRGRGNLADKAIRWW